MAIIKFIFALFYWFLGGYLVYTAYDEYEFTGRIKKSSIATFIILLLTGVLLVI